MRVKQIENVLDLLELFARDGEPLTLTAIATALSAPKSSAFNIIDTLVQRGYLYETRPRGGYYPTALLSEVANAIAEADPLVQRLHGALTELAAATGETALLSMREGNEIVYLERGRVGLSDPLFRPHRPPPPPAHDIERPRHPVFLCACGARSDPGQAAAGAGAWRGPAGPCCACG